MSFKKMTKQILNPVNILEENGFPIVKTRQQCEKECISHRNDSSIPNNEKCSGYHYTDENECALYKKGKLISSVNSNTAYYNFDRKSEAFASIDNDEKKFKKINTKKESCSFIESGIDLRIIPNKKYKNSCRDACLNDSKCKAFILKDEKCYLMNKCILEPIPVDEVELYVKKDIEKFGKMKGFKRISGAAGSLSGIGKRVKKVAKKVGKRARKVAGRAGSSMKRTVKKHKGKFAAAAVAGGLAAGSATGAFGEDGALENKVLDDLGNTVINTGKNAGKALEGGAGLLNDLSKDPLGAVKNIFAKFKKIFIIVGIVILILLILKFM